MTRDVLPAGKWQLAHRQASSGLPQEPAEMGPVATAVFDDTCGNLIQIEQRR